METTGVRAGSQQISDDARISMDLAASIKVGSPLAEQRLVERYAAGLRFLVRGYTRDECLTEDVVQDTFIVVLTRLRTRGIDDPCKLTPFVHKTARNITIGVIRKLERRKTYPDHDKVALAVSDAETQEGACVRVQNAMAVRQLLCELQSPRDREILTRFYLAEEDKITIRQDLALGEVHFNRVLYRARKRFGELLRGYEKQTGISLLPVD